MSLFKKEANTAKHPLIFRGEDTGIFLEDLDPYSLLEIGLMDFLGDEYIEFLEQTQTKTLGPQLRDALKRSKEKQKTGK